MFGREINRRQHARHGIRGSRCGFEAKEVGTVFDDEIAEGSADVDSEPHFSLAPNSADACMECAARLGKDAGLLDPNRLNGLLTTWRRDRDVQSDRLTELFEMRAVPEGLCARNAAATFDETEAAMRRHIESTQGNFTMLPPVG
jgi:hypothetical protein